MDKYYIQALYIVLEFNKEVPMSKTIFQFPNLGEYGKFGHHPASRLATSNQVFMIHKSYWKYDTKSMEIINEKLKILSESDIENILIDNFHRFVIDFQTLRILITWLQDTSL